MVKPTIVEPRWLSADEQGLWLELREFASGLPRALDRQLSADSSLSSGEYAILAAVSEAAAGSVRSGDLAAGLQWDRSRVSHLLRRMETRGVVERCAAAGDGRGQVISLTAEGWKVLRAAAPGHVSLVREAVFDPLTEAEQQALGEYLGKIRAALAERGLW
ncbi:MarR family winged helix-turn-helix transcriptional regulator [Tomitella biformata]|uniref:MarR family winged helix-turn-helix transcriptional regulator n=1 Tax=Tomitella biformata TaxID=630403 RepID=UPI0004B58071|nr:MarR family winged helix-turn-helix transcriptional regulator [Tomitella biformata]